MSDRIPPLLVLLMWNLLFTGEEPMVSKAKPGVDRKKLQPLLDAQLIVLEKRGRASHIVLTDRAWQWAEAHLDAEFSPRANATPALQGLLPRLKAYLQHTGTPLAELLSAEATGPGRSDAVAVPAPVPVASPVTGALEPPQATPTIVIDEAIQMAYLALSGNQWETRVRLAGLRERLRHYPRSEQDKALLRMQSEGRLVLYRLDDPQDTFEVDRAAALYIGSDPRHLVYMKG